jgi:apolipoprotein N-acyltransferase
MTERRRLPVYLAAVLGGVAISVAWWFPDTHASALLGWASAALLVYAVRARRAYLPAYVCGVTCCTLGFYWVFRTVSVYGQMGPVPAAALFAAFALGSAVQFLIFAFIHHHLGPRCDALALRSPVALVLSEFIAVRIFVWHYGHTQVAWTPLVQVADLAGAGLVSFLMFWVAEVAVRAAVFREWRRSFLLPWAALGLALGYGLAMVRAYSDPAGEPQEVVLVQGNIPMILNGDREAVAPGVRKLFELSRKAAVPNALIVWPENSIPILVPVPVESARKSGLLPALEDGSAFVVGSYAEEADGKRRIAAFAVEPSGRVPRPYYKQVLVPFGEYVPGGSIVPWLEALNANFGGFRAGDRAEVFALPMRRADGTPYTLALSPLVCYEDTVPGLSRRATRLGAGLLVNVTNDSWFGPTAAPYEHHLIASFRAIENRRFLLRATNTGLTAVVDPLGRTVARLPPFTAGTLRARVVLLKNQSMYTRYIGDWPWWALLTAAGATILAGKVRSARAGRRGSEAVVPS